MPFPNPDTQFQPGHTGNPAGYSKGRRLATELFELIEEKAAWRSLAAVTLKGALEGDIAFLRVLFDRLDGPLGEKLDITTDGKPLHQPVVFLPIKDLHAECDSDRHPPAQGPADSIPGEPG